MRPITPREVVAQKKDTLPPEVLEAFNTLIVKHYQDGVAVFEQDAVMELIMDRLFLTRAEVFSRRLLEVEDIYRDAGWKVFYEKSAHCESFGATFTFAKTPPKQ